MRAVNLSHKVHFMLVYLLFYPILHHFAYATTGTTVRFELAGLKPIETESESPLEEQLADRLSESRLELGKDAEPCKTVEDVKGELKLPSVQLCPFAESQE